MEYRYRRTSYRCSDCKFCFDKLRKFAVDKYPHGTDLPMPKKDPDCPQCEKVKKVSLRNSVTDDTHRHINPSNAEGGFVGGTPEAPAKAFTMGGSNFTKAMDATADIVMKDYGLTNLQDNLRAGDTMAPKLQGVDGSGVPLEQRVSEVFAPPKRNIGQQTGKTFNKTLMNQINQGMYKAYGGANDVVARQQSSNIRVPTNVIFEHGRGKPS